MLDNNFTAALLLDLDGTLVDTANDFIHILTKMCDEDGLKAPAPTTIRNTVSDGARALITLCYKLKQGESGFEEKRQTLLKRYENELGNNAALFDGFEEVFDYCKTKNIAWAVVTNKPWLYTNLLLNRLDIKPSNNVIICPDHVNKTKPDPEPLFLAAKKLGIRNDKCFYAGDHFRDIEAGKNANMQTIACNYGYIKENDDPKNWCANFYVNTPKDIITVLP